MHTYKAREPTVDQDWSVLLALELLPLNWSTPMRAKSIKLDLGKQHPISHGGNCHKLYLLKLIDSIYL